jgi:hypothetical protein
MKQLSTATAEICVSPVPVDCWEHVSVVLSYIATDESQCSNASCSNYKQAADRVFEERCVFGGTVIGQ